MVASGILRAIPLVQGPQHKEDGDLWRETEMRVFLNPFLATGFSDDVAQNKMIVHGQMGELFLTVLCLCLALWLCSFTDLVFLSVSYCPQPSLSVTPSVPMGSCFVSGRDCSV